MSATDMWVFGVKQGAVAEIHGEVRVSRLSSLDELPCFPLMERYSRSEGIGCRPEGKETLLPIPTNALPESKCRDNRCLRTQDAGAQADGVDKIQTAQTVAFVG